MCNCWRFAPASRINSSATCGEIFLPNSSNRWRTTIAARPPRSFSLTVLSSKAANFLTVFKKLFRLSTFPALINNWTPCQSNDSQLLANSVSRSVTAALDAVRSSPRKFAPRSHTTLLPPKNGSVCSASFSLANACSASSALRTVPSTTS